MTERTINIPHIWHDSVGGECHGNLAVTYVFHRGCSPTMTDPGEPASVEVVSIVTDAPERTIDRDLVEQECMAEYADYLADAAEYRAEQRRDAAMMERF